MANNILSARLPRLSFDRDSPLGRFWHWWSGELIALAPQWLRQSGAGAANSLMIEVTPQAIVLRRWLAEGLSEQGRIELQAGGHSTDSVAFQALFSKLHKRGEGVSLCLTEAQYLAKQIELPLAADENLRQVLGFEMDRLTPFKPEQVYFDFRVLHRDNQKNRLTVKLVAAPRHAVDGQLDLLARWGAPALAVYVSDTVALDGDAINLMASSGHSKTGSSVEGKVKLGLLLLTLMLGMAAIAIPLWQERQASMALIPVVEQAKQQAEAADALRREQEKLTAEYNFMLVKKQEIPPLVVLLDELSRLLPDDTWVQQFSLKGKELQIQGETASSARLIALAESSRILHNANFRSPLTKGSAPNSERYQLAAEVREQPVAAPAAQVTSMPPIEPQPPAMPLPPVEPHASNGNGEPGNSEAAKPNPPFPQARSAFVPVRHAPFGPSAKTLAHPEVTL
jgi:general secretion pathway protein L